MTLPKDPKKAEEYRKKLSTRIITPEWRKKNSQAQKARFQKDPKTLPTMLGKKHSPETIARMQEIHKKENLSEETRKRLSESSAAYRHTEETKQKMSKANKGQKRSDEFRSVMSKVHKGRKLTEETKEKMRVSSRKYWNSEKAQGKKPGILLGAQSKKYKFGHHESLKAGRVFYRSSFELTYYKILDKDSTVLTYIPEPFYILYQHEGRNKRYYPDLLVLYKGGFSKIIEIKPKEFLSDPMNKCKFLAAKAQYKDSFKIITQEDLF